MKQALLQIARNMVEVSQGHLRLAFNEEDETTDQAIDAAHFLKLDDKRIGRDVELYGLMAEVQGAGSTLCDFLLEVVMCLKSLPEVYAAGIDGLRALGREHFDGEKQQQWEEILTT